MNVRSSKPRDNRQYEFRPRKLKAWVILLCIVRSLLAPGLLPAREGAVAVERAVPVRMRDGVVLYADIYRPAKVRPLSRAARAYPL